MTTLELHTLHQHVLTLPRPQCYAHMDHDDEWVGGCGQMLSDLHRLATADGCVAAAWALAMLEAAAKGGAI